MTLGMVLVVIGSVAIGGVAANVTRKQGAILLLGFVALLIGMKIP